MNPPNDDRTHFGYKTVDAGKKADLVRGVFERLMGTRNPCPEFLKYEQKVPGRPGGEIEAPASGA